MRNFPEDSFVSKIVSRDNLGVEVLELQCRSFSRYVDVNSRLVSYRIIRLTGALQVIFFMPRT